MIKKQDDSEESSADRMSIIQMVAHAIDAMLPKEEKQVRAMLAKQFSDPVLSQMVAALTLIRERMRPAVWKRLDYACQELDGEHATHMEETDKFLMELQNRLHQQPREILDATLKLFARDAPTLNALMIAPDVETYAMFFANCLIGAIKPPYRVKTREELANEDTKPSKASPKPH